MVNSNYAINEAIKKPGLCFAIDRVNCIYMELLLIRALFMLSALQKT